MRCPISSLVVNEFKYKICDTCLLYVDLIHTHVLHLIHLWTPVHLMSQYVICIGYVHSSNKTPFISWKENMNILINKEFNQFITSTLMNWDHKTNNLPLGLNASQRYISCPSHPHTAQTLVVRGLVKGSSRLSSDAILVMAMSPLCTISLTKWYFLCTYFWLLWLMGSLDCATALLFSQ